MIESLDNFARFSDFCAKNQLENSARDLFSCAYVMGEHPSFGEFKKYCRLHLRLSVREHKEYIIALWNDMEDCRWLKKNGKPAKDWRTLVNVHNGILLRKYNIQRKERKDPNTYMPYFGLETAEEEYPENGRHYVCYTDGSCDNVKSKAGGSAYIIIKDGEIVKMKSHGSPSTTNNRMELLAIISAVNSCPDNACVDVYTDSKYCIYVLSKKTAPQINKDLYELFKKCSAHVEGVRFHWVKGHNGDKYNEMADDMAYGAYCDICDEYHFKKMTRH